MRRLSLTRLCLAAALSTSLLLAGCGGDEESGEKGTDGQEDVNRPDAAPGTWPLTGLAVDDGDTAELTHPILVTKVDNTEGSSPQAGLGHADLVVEEAVEGRVTRLAVFYYSDLPSVVGPVRSMRASDIGIVSPVGGSMVTSGAAGVTISRIQAAGIPFYAEGSAGFSRSDDRSAPYNLFADLTQVAKSATTDEPSRPDDYLPWGTAEDLPNGQPATTIAAAFGSHTTNWIYRDGRYVNDNTFAAGDDQFPTTAVLTLSVDVGDAGYLDPAGNKVPETKFVGSGEAILFYEGRAVRGTWTKKDLGSPLQLATKAGDLTVPPGHVWVELVPKDTGEVTFR